ncbi:InlB B-repeat-containing protein [Eubacterium sp.]|uniref:InlB B-repeat-containing protein n=1 Tax=Eubacterium sp. TaxID=142586 RepID=UPI003AB49068
MKKTWKKMASMFLSVLLMLSMVITPAMAAEGTTSGSKDAPTKVKSCAKSGLWSDILNLEFDDTTWMNAIDSITVNDTVYKNKTISSFGSETGIWDIGSATGAYGSYTALRIAKAEDASYPLTVKVTANGYKNLTVEITKTTVSYNDVYTATVVKDATPAEKTYTATAASAEYGKVTLDKTSGLKAGDSVTVTTTPDRHYELDTLTVKGASGTVNTTKKSENEYSFTMPAEDVNVTAAFKKAAPIKINLDQVKIGTDFFGNDREVTFDNVDGYVSDITKVSVNGTEWEKKSYISSGGVYKADTDNNKLVFAAKDYSSTETTPVLKSGDVITITADGYEDLTMKFVIDPDGKASLVEDDGQGDPYQIYVKIEGTFDSAIKGQTNYDTVSSASTGGSSSNKNSDVTVYGALVKKGTEPTESDWEELDNMSKINLNGKKCTVNIVPDTDKGTSADSDSGMQGVYMTLSSALSLGGTPKDPGKYLVSVTITDMQGRTATSNTLPFNVYSGEEKLADQLVKDNLKQYAHGKYAWDIMEPWAVSNFGSNVAGEDESVRVPADLEAWFGSHVSGTYGYLGYDLAWKEVEKGNIPQTLYIPDGCDLTITNMEILSSVRIVVEKGGKLTLDDSVVQGIIEVKDGGTFSMNYSAYDEEFKVGASICGQLRLEDGATLENAAIYSHANYLANGNLTDRTTSEPVVTATGNVTIKGKVFIEGDDAGSDIGQTALCVSNGTLHLEDGAELVAYGGSGKTLLYSDGGAAIDLDNATIDGNGKITAIGGDVLWGNGGNAVTGNGTIAAESAFLQGATANTSKNAKAGNATVGTIKVTGKYRHIANGSMISGAENDPLADLYWKTGIDPEAPLDQFVTSEVTKLINVVDIESQVYNGEVLKPVVKVTDADDTEKVLTEDVDYFVTYTQPAQRSAADEYVNAGDYTVAVTGMGEYYGTATKTFTIDPKQMRFDVTADSDSAIYDGQSKTPTLTIKDGDTVLTEGIDYTVSYTYGSDSNAADFTGAEFVKAGEYTIFVTGIGNYAGSTGKVVFTVKQNSSNNNNNRSDNGNNFNAGNNNGNTNTDQNKNQTVNNNKNSGKGSAASNKTNQTAAATAKAPKTADTNAMLLWLVMLVIAGGALTTTMYSVKKHK